MTVVEALRELEALLLDEERALIAVELDAALAVATRKSELVALIEQGLPVEAAPLSAEALNLARSVHEKAHKNRFLLRHLRSCLSLVNPVATATQTYGRDGRRTTLGGGAMVRVRL
jgi:hypothetical protein